MQIKKLLQEDNAVSPVIGVILMVAITVILAAVIASFVLGLGGNTTQNPQASFSWDYEQLETDGDTEYGITTISHDGGDSIPAGELYFRGSGWGDVDDSDSDFDEYDSISDPLLSDDGSWTGGSDTSDTSEVSSGMSADIAVNSDFDIQLVWEPAEGDTSATLSEETGPDA